MQYCPLQHWILLSSADTSTTDHHFHFGPAASLFLELLVVVLHSFPVAHWTLSNLGLLIFQCHIFFAILYSSWGSHGKYTWVVCHSLLWWITFCQNSPLWPVCLWWPCMAWLIASLSYTSPFATTRQWIMEGYHLLPYTKVQTDSYGDRKSFASPILQSPMLPTKCTQHNFYLFIFNNKSYIWQTYSKHYPQWWKNESISSKVRNKTTVPTFTTTIKHSFGSFGHSNQSRKRNKRNPNWKRRSKALTVCRWHDPLHRKP